jgi:hypothetical protein
MLLLLLYQRKKLRQISMLLPFSIKEKESKENRKMLKENKTDLTSENPIKN